MKDGESKGNSHLTLISTPHADEHLALPEGVDAASVDKAALQQLLDLRTQHRQLDEEIQALVTSAAIDQLLLKRLKKRKLMLKDQITKVEDSMLPDIIA